MILVTGATGLNGTAIMREFARHKHAARALLRDPARASASGLDRLAGVELVEGDMRRAETLGPALDGVERVLMISTAAEDMTETQCRFIDACRKAGVAHVVKFSGAESNIGYDATKFRFTRMHEEIERYLEGAGMVWTHLRPSQFMQVYLRDAPTIAAEGAFYLALGETELSPVDVEDIAKVAFRLLRDGGHADERLEMTGPEALTMSDIAARISQATGKPIRYVDISPEQRRCNLLAAGIPTEFADALDEQLAERRRRPKSRVHLATHEMFGVRPTPFLEFARRHVAMFSGAA
ncbi:SDR family oxidoreductase [Mesorhizobium sp. BR1-1-9]|uniref:SDR family oxidoreductase n=1 Tax=unclassified Mesorhizobium TaxID=325217 RepID=UPI001CD184CA|nr:MULTISPECIES: SDR family oxidoreductase [unclassified Mesorhizobium]MBZ9871819.1 SDR family oxidoreductase [Mesorhizobium sp. BR1-1-9]MBZ9944325.1 SDR family oxidoreductase [Mesorhizobium sp. BR1-1-13]